MMKQDEFVDPAFWHHPLLQSNWNYTEESLQQDSQEQKTSFCAEILKTREIQQEPQDFASLASNKCCSVA